MERARAVCSVLRGFYGPQRRGGPIQLPVQVGAGGQHLLEPKVQGRDAGAADAGVHDEGHARRRGQAHLEDDAGGKAPSFLLLCALVEIQVQAQERAPFCDWRRVRHGNSQRLEEPHP